MPLAADLLARRTSHFLLWRPNESVTPPLLVLGRFQPGNPPTLTDERQFTMKPAAGVSGLWQIAASDCGLADGDIIHFGSKSKTLIRTGACHVLCAALTRLPHRGLAPDGRFRESASSGGPVLGRAANRVRSRRREAGLQRRCAAQSAAAEQ